MKYNRKILNDYERIRHAALGNGDGLRCTVAPAPELKERIKKELAAIRATTGTALGALARAVEPVRPGLNDGLIVPADQYPLGTPFSIIRSAAADRAPLRGTVRVIVVLVDFSDRAMTQTQAHFRELFFSNGVIPTKSVREYFAEVTNGTVDIQGDVIGPLRLPRTLAQYAHGASGLGSASPNAQTMARDAAIAADPLVNFAPYDNDGNGFVDAFIVIHAGSGGEQTGNANDIWSHKWVLEGGARTVDTTKIFAYLTVPEDSKIGVCCHELGHLLFGFPDLYDTDGSSEGLGNWCLMAGGSWGGGGNTPVHPSAWCKANQGWVAVDNRNANSLLNIPDVKDSHTVYRLWKDGAPGTEYYLMENRQQKGFDVSLPQSGLLIFHVDESVSGNTNENHYKIALMQADGKRDMELNHNRGDGGDPYPGTSGNANFNNTSTPNSKSYAGIATCVSVTGISVSGPVMTANVAVKCKQIEKLITKDIRDTKLIEKDRLKEIREKRPEKPQIDKSSARDKGLIEKTVDGKFSDGKLVEGGGLGGGLGGGGSQSELAIAHLEARVSALESALSGQSGVPAPQPFIGSQLRPDLSQGAFSAEEDFSEFHEQMRQGSADAKRQYDTKLKEQP